MAAAWKAIQVTCVSFSLLFAILALATESWTQVTVDAVKGSAQDGVCAPNDSCFILDIDEWSVMMSGQSVVDAINEKGRTTITGDDVFLNPFNDDKSTVVEVTNIDAQVQGRLGELIVDGQLEITIGSSPYTARPLPPAPPPQSSTITVDFGLFNECFSKNLAIPDFDNTVHSTICLRKIDLCNVADDSKIASAAEASDVGDIQKGISTICHKMTAVSVFCFFILFLLAIFIALMYVPAITSRIGACAGMWVQVGLLSAVAVFALIAVSVWGSADVDGANLEDHLQQLYNVYLSSDLFYLQNTSVSMGFSSGYVITILLLMVFAAASTAAAQKDVALCIRPCGLPSTNSKQAYSISADDITDDDEASLPLQNID